MAAGAWVVVFAFGAAGVAMLAVAAARAPRTATLAFVAVMLTAACAVVVLTAGGDGRSVPLTATKVWAVCAIADAALWTCSVAIIVGCRMARPLNADERWLADVADGRVDPFA